MNRHARVLVLESSKSRIRGETSSNVWYRIILSVTDSHGSVGKDSVDVFPRKSMLTFKTLPVALQLTLDGQPIETPASLESVELSFSSNQTLFNYKLLIQR
jgi:hypothetical protein